MRCLFIFIFARTKSKTFLMNVHSYVNCVIIHIMTSNLYAVIPVTIVSFQFIVYR